MGVKPRPFARCGSAPAATNCLAFDTKMVSLGLLVYFWVLARFKVHDLLVSFNVLFVLFLVIIIVFREF